MRRQSEIGEQFEIGEIRARDIKAIELEEIARKLYKAFYDNFVMGDGYKEREGPFEEGVFEEIVLSPKKVYEAVEEKASEGLHEDYVPITKGVHKTVERETIPTLTTEEKYRFLFDLMDSLGISREEVLRRLSEELYKPVSIDEDLPSFGRYLQMVRKRKGFKSMKALAEAAGIPFGTLMKYEYDARSPRIEHLNKLVEVLDDPTLYIVAGKLPDDPELKRMILSYIPFFRERMLKAATTPPKKLPKKLKDISFGEYLKRKRKEKGFRTAKELAEATGIPLTVIQNYEAGRRIPRSHHHLKALASTLEDDTLYVLAAVERIPDTKIKRKLLSLVSQI
jgi:transcriptional regulator with XRE-family HTH domain